MTEITIDDFSKIELRIGKVIEATDVEESDKLIRLKVDFGEKGEKKIFAGVKKWYKPKDLEEKSLCFVFNLKSKKMLGEDSQGMMLAAEDEKGETCVLIVPEKDIDPGTRII